MPTDLAVAIRDKQAARQSAAQDQWLVLIGPALFGLLSMLLAAQNPDVAAAIVLMGLQ